MALVGEQLALLIAHFVGRSLQMQNAVAVDRFEISLATPGDDFRPRGSADEQQQRNEASCECCVFAGHCYSSHLLNVRIQSGTGNSGTYRVTLRGIVNQVELIRIVTRSVLAQNQRRESTL